MIFEIKEDSGHIEFHERFYYEWALKRIEGIREGLEQRDIEKRVINELDSVKDFWSTHNFYSNIEDCEPYLVLEKMLVYFGDERRTKFSDSKERVQNFFDELKEYLIDEEDLEVIKKKIGTKGLDSYQETATAEYFFENINYKIRKLQIMDKYIGSNHEEKIFRYKFVENTMKRFGMSDSYLAQHLYYKLDRYDGEKCEVDDGIPWIVSTLEMYRCIAKKSTATKDEVLEKYSPRNK